MSTATETPTTTQHDRAQALAALGMLVFPVREADTLNDRTGEILERKTPYTANGLYSGTTNGPQILEWFQEEHPEALIGVWCGPSGILVVDVDEHPGQPSGHATIAEQRLNLNTTYSYATASGNGEHHIYQAPVGDLRSDARTYPGVDVLAGNHYIIWHGPVPFEREFADPPGWAADLANRPATGTEYSGTVTAWLEAHAGQPDGEVQGFIDRLPAAGPDVYGHDHTLARLRVLMGLAGEGHPGVAVAVEALRGRYLAGEWDTPQYAAEWSAMLAWAVGTCGGTPPEPAVTPAEDFPFSVVTRTQLRNRPKPPWLIDGFLQGSGVVVLAGEAGLGKSFLCLDIAAHIATGMLWQGRTTRPGRVLYVAGEGVEFFDDRVTAWETHNGADVDDANLLYVEEGFNLSDNRAVLHMRTLVEKEQYDLVILDTLSQLSAVENENDAAQVSAVLRAAKAIREVRPGATVLIVHHINKGEKGKVRGSSAIRGNADAVIVGRGTSEKFALSTHAEWDGKQKNGRAEKIDGFRLIQVGASAVVDRYQPRDKADLAIDRVLADGDPHRMAEFLSEMGFGGTAKTAAGEAARKDLQRRLSADKTVSTEGFGAGTRYRRN